MSIKQNKRGSESARRSYVQSVLSGFSSVDKPKNENTDNSPGKPTIPTSPYFWQQKSYIVFVPFIVTETSISGDAYNYQVQVALDVNVPIQPYKPRSKNLLGQVFNLDAEKVRGGAGIHMVYGVSTSGFSSLSPTTNTPLPEILAHIYGRTMGTLNRAIERILHFSGKAQQGESVNDTGERQEEPLTRTNVRATKARAGRKKIRSKIRSKTLPENTTSLDETYGKVLGERPENGSSELAGVGNDTSNRETT